MKKTTASPWVRCLAALALLACTAAARAARIAEPGVVLYGKVVQRVGPDSLPVPAGRLTWTVRTTGAGSRDLVFTSDIAPFGDAPAGPFSYRLTLPSQVLAYDLAVRPGAVPLAAATTKVQFVSVTLNGKPVTIAPIVATGLQVDQTRRAGAVRVDLSVDVIGMDSDGDGYPDDWEDANGYDKWDPLDNPRSVAAGVTTGGGATAGTAAKTLSEWRAAWFPGQTGDLAMFANQDADGDGIVNLLEYAFDLDPTRKDADTPRILPHSIVIDGRQGVGYRRHPNATDLAFGVDRATDLVNWEDALPHLEIRAPSDASDHRTLLVEKASEGDNAFQFYRVVVRRP